MERATALTLLPTVYARALAFDAQGLDANQLAARLDVDVSSVGPLLRVARAKLAALELLDAIADQAGTQPAEESQTAGNAPLEEDQMTRQPATRRVTQRGAEHLRGAGPKNDRSSTPPPSVSPRERPSGDEAVSRRGSRPRRRTLRVSVRVLVVALAVALVGAVVGPYVYIHFVAGQPPKKLTFETTNSRAATGTGRSAKPTAPLGVAGAWKVTRPSTVGYRVPETIMGQGTTAVGRTAAVTGNLSITDSTVRTAEFTVDVANIASDAPQRDADYRRVMETATSPTATFVLTSPIALATIPVDLQEITVPVAGNLTLHGISKPVTFALKARRNGPKIEVNGSIPITFSNYKIASPSIAGAIVVGNEGELEFLLVFSRP